MLVNRRLWRAFSSACSAELAKALSRCTGSVRDLIDEERMLGISLFRHEQHLFLYYESVGDELEPGDFLGQLEQDLEFWPGEELPRRWVELVDVFHFNAPASIEHWRRKSPVEKHIGKIGRLRPELISKYIFYHYALQEEQAFGGDKYEIIGLHENYLFGYFEEPELIEQPVNKPILDINVVPSNWSDAGITDCFIPWSDDSDVRFKPMKELVSIWEEE